VVTIEFTDLEFQGLLSLVSVTDLSKIKESHVSGAVLGMGKLCFEQIKIENKEARDFYRNPNK
jgi:hypothetical protein